MQKFWGTNFILKKFSGKPSLRKWYLRFWKELSTLRAKKENIPGRKNSACKGGRELDTSEKLKNKTSVTGVYWVRGHFLVVKLQEKFGVTSFKVNLVRIWVCSECRGKVWGILHKWWYDHIKYHYDWYL